MPNCGTGWRTLRDGHTAPAQRRQRETQRRPTKAKKVPDFAAGHSSAPAGGLQLGFLQPALVNTAHTLSGARHSAPRRQAIKVLKPCNCAHHERGGGKPRQAGNIRWPLKWCKRAHFQFFWDCSDWMLRPPHGRRMPDTAARTSRLRNPTTHYWRSRMQPLDAEYPAITRNIGFPTPGSGTVRPASAG